MAHFYIWETVDLPIHLTPKEAFEDYKSIIVSLSQGQVLLNKDEKELGIDTEQGIINMHLSQEETGMFVRGKLELQVNIYYDNKERDTSIIARLEARDNLYKKVMNGDE